MQKNLENKKEEKITKKYFLSILFGEVFLFSLVFLFGIFSAIRISEIIKKEAVVLPAISFWEFVLYFLLATFFVLLASLLPKIKKTKKLIFRLLFIFSAIYGGLISLSSFLPDIFSLLTIGLLLYWWLRAPNIFSHNLLMVLGLAGIGAILGLTLKPEVVVLLLLFFSVYDFIAVYKTKHMIKMAKSMAESGVIMAFIIPPKIASLKKNPREIKLGGRFVVLGGGDVVFPLILATSVLSKGFLEVLIVSIFSLIGLGFSFLLFSTQKEKKPMPALPPIALFSIIGFLITKLL
jgi:presenilin-like A22 family membrane protease